MFNGMIVFFFTMVIIMVVKHCQTFKLLQSTEDSSKDIALQLRDRFAAEYHLRAVDAGFDSVIAAVVGSRIDSWALIRGITDYQHGQSRAGRLWQVHSVFLFLY